jgi:hypothetical protein
MGWGEVEGSEDPFISDSSLHGVSTAPSDWSRNLSVLSGSPVALPLQQKRQDVSSKTEQVHYVCFYVSDGDNLQWNLNRRNNTQWWGSPSRGSFKLGWTMPPTLIDLAPSVAKWYYDTAVGGMDNFIVGPSGNGFIFPSLYPKSTLDLHTQRLNQYMEKTDTQVVAVIDKDALSKTAVWDPYTQQPRVQGLFYYEWIPYVDSPEAGKIVWSRGKPVISTRYKLANTISGAVKKIDLIKALNKSPRFPLVGKRLFLGRGGCLE